MHEARTLRSGFLRAALCSLLASACTEHRSAHEALDLAPDVAVAGTPAPFAAGQSGGVETPAAAEARPSAASDASVTERETPTQDAAATPTRDSAAVPNVAELLDAAADVVILEPGFTGEVAFEATTKPTIDSPYQPKHVLAIWVEDEAGEPVKLLGRWAGIMVRLLLQYMERVAPLVGQDLLAWSPVPDAITVATQRVHEARSVTWDLTDFEGEFVPDGVYRIVIEVSDNHDQSVVTSVAFDKGPEAMLIERAEDDAFGPIRLEYTPPD